MKINLFDCFVSYERFFNNSHSYSALFLRDVNIFFYVNVTGNLF